MEKQTLLVSLRQAVKQGSRKQFDELLANKSFAEIVEIAYLTSETSNN